MARPKASTSRTLTIEVEGARELRTVLKELGEKKLLRQLAKQNKAFAEIVVREAIGRAQGSRNRIVAKGLQAGLSQANVAIRLEAMADVHDKRGPRPVGLGSEFGAYQNRKRLEKNTGGRRTIVREGESVNKVIRRVEDQTRMGFDTVKKRARQKWGATPVKVTKIVSGWNMYEKWRGNKANAGYFLYPAIREHRGKIAEKYAENIARIWRDLR
jgi:hypothetical protein